MVTPIRHGPDHPEHWWVEVKEWGPGYSETHRYCQICNKEWLEPSIEDEITFAVGKKVDLPPHE